MKHIISHIIISVLFLTLWACKSEVVREDGAMRLYFSTDTVCFDTIFTEQGSTTMRVMIYNKNAHAMRISQIDKQTNTCFHLNIDGEANPENWHDIEVRGGDSLYLFVQAKIDPQNSNNPVFIEEKVAFHSNGNTDTLVLQAYGQDVMRLRGKNGMLRIPFNYTFNSKKPYLVMDTVVFDGKVTFQPGATIYMHKGGLIYFLDQVTANGTLDQPIRILGDRRDQLFTNVPYAYAAGQWDGLYLLQDSKDPITHQWTLDHVEITSGNIGLYCQNEANHPLPKLTLRNSRIHNMALYGLVLQNIDAIVENCEISNAASYCAYLAGGNHRFVHTTIASYFNATNVRIQSTAREDVAAVYINNLNKDMAKDSTTFLNSIIAGARTNQLVVATPFDQLYPGRFEGCYLQTDTLRLPGASNNVYGTHKDTVFVNTYYEYEVYEYYDFHLDSVSPARGIGLSDYALPFDREGKERIAPISAGCY